MSSIIPLPNGAQAALAITLGTAKAISALTNANPAVATSTAHGLTEGDVCLASVAAWQYVHNTVIRVQDETTNDFEFEGVNSTSTAQFPAGATGSVREITAWEAITLIPQWELTGGDAKTGTTSYLDKEKDVNFILGANPEGLNFAISYRPDSAMHAALIAAGRSGELQVMRLVLKDGSTIYYVGELFYNPVPTTTKDNEMVCMGMLALQGDVTRFAAAA